VNTTAFVAKTEKARPRPGFSKTFDFEDDQSR
jgi:hypothetical protein